MSLWSRSKALKVFGILLIGCLFAAAAVLAACGGRADFAETDSPLTQTSDAGPSCNEGWSYFRDANERFSFCYPPEMTLMISRAEPYNVAVELPAGSGAASEANVVGFSIFWRSQSRFQPGLVTGRCRLEEQHFEASTHEVAMTFAGQAVVACRAD